MGGWIFWQIRYQFRLFSCCCIFLIPPPFCSCVFTLSLTTTATSILLLLFTYLLLYTPFIFFTLDERVNIKGVCFVAVCDPLKASERTNESVCNTIPSLESIELNFSYKTEIETNCEV